MTADIERLDAMAAELEAEAEDFGQVPEGARLAAKCLADAELVRAAVAEIHALRATFRPGFLDGRRARYPRNVGDMWAEQRSYARMTFEPAPEPGDDEDDERRPN